MQDKITTILLKCGTVKIFGEQNKLKFLFMKKPRLFENRLLKKIFGSKKDKVTGEWRKLHNEQLYDLYHSPSIIWVITKNETGGAGGMYGRQYRCIHSICGKT